MPVRIESLPAKIKSLCYRLFHRERIDSDLDAEIQSALALLTDQKIAQGISAAEARRAAIIELGGVEQVKEEVRASRTGAWLDSLLQDIRFALRMLRKSPAFTATVILILAIGIGANTAIFSLIDAIMLRPLPIRNSDGLYILKWQANHPPRRLHASEFWPGCPVDYKTRNSSCSISYPLFDEIRSQQTTFSSVAGFEEEVQLHLSGSAPVGVAQGEFVSGEFFSALGVRPAAGRLIAPSDDTPASAPAVVLSYAYWKAHFDGQLSVIGSSMLIEGKPVTIAGVAPDSFTGLNPGVPCDLWLPLNSQPSLMEGWLTNDPNSQWVELVARIKPGVSVAQAQAATNVIFVRATTAPAGIFNPEDAPHVELVDLARGLVTLRRQFRSPLLILLAAVGILLLIACTNVAGLLLARATARKREMAVRLALGASHARLIRQLLTESLLLSLAGGVLGIGVAYSGASSLAAFLSENWYRPLSVDVRPDPYVLAFTFVVAVAAGVFFGLAPAFRVVRVDLTPALKMGPAAVRRQRGGNRLLAGGGMVVAQVALSIVILVVAGLFVRTLINLETQDVGFDTQNLLLFSVDPGVRNYTVDQFQALRAELDRQFEALPGVVSISYSTWWPLAGSQGQVQLSVPDAPEKPELPSAELWVGPNFFPTMRIALISGRDFTLDDFDTKANPQPVLVNRMLARRLFGSENPLGQRVVDTFRPKVMHQVVGVVADVKSGEPRNPIRPTIYLPQITNSGANFELRTAGDPRTLIPAVRRVVSGVNGNASVSEIRTQTEELDRLLYQERLFAWLSSLFGLLALALVCAGLYGLVAFEVAQRTAEIGIRRALGAQPLEVFALFVRRGIVLVGIGAALGTVAALGLTRYLRSLLFDVAPIDSTSLVIVVGLLLIVTLAACWIPARRATRVDPMIALRHD
ncbi:MAG TPA: ABC transporter permease [Candidatus Acidoferrales bacterium]